MPSLGGRAGQGITESLAMVGPRNRFGPLVTSRAISRPLLQWMKASGRRGGLLRLTTTSRILHEAGSP